MAKNVGRIVVDIEGCKGCGVCVPACPTNVIQLAENVNGKGFHYAYMANEDACTGCMNCALVCPDAVITVYRKKVNA